MLLSGDHARIARGATTESVRRTAERRPDLAHPLSAVDLGDLAGELRLGRPVRRRGAAHAAARLLAPGAAGEPRRHIPALQEDLADVQAWMTVDDARPPGRRAPRRARLAGAGRARPGTSAGSWPPPICRAGDRAPPARRHRGGRAGGGDRLRAVHRRRERAQHPDVQEGRLPTPRQDQDVPGAVRLTEPRPATQKSAYVPDNRTPDTPGDRRSVCQGLSRISGRVGGGSGRLAPRSSRSRLQLVCVPYELLADVEDPQSGYRLLGFDQLDVIGEASPIRVQALFQIGPQALV